MKKRIGAVLALCLLLTGCGQEQTEKPGGSAAASSGQNGRDPAPTEVVLEGETVSPDGAWKIELADLSQGLDPDALPAKHWVTLCGTADGRVIWEDGALLEQSVLWSSDSRYAAIARTARTYAAVTVVSTQTGEACEVRLPDGSAIPEYTFLPEQWGTWVDENTLELTVGRGGDAGEQRVYRCSFAGENPMESSVVERVSEVLPGDYDFTHDGQPETVELVTMLGPYGYWYELRVNRPDGSLLWSREGDGSHIGWVNLFAYEEDGLDYILDYNPGMWQGWANYSCRLFSLGENGEEEILREKELSFDVNFDYPDHGSFDVEEIAAFLEEVHGYLDDSTRLLCTSGTEKRTGGSGADFREDHFWELYEEAGTWEEKLQAYQDTYAH